jgi:hypothetical protein
LEECLCGVADGLVLDWVVLDVDVVELDEDPPPPPHPATTAVAARVASNVRMAVSGVRLTGRAPGVARRLGRSP